MTSEPPSPSAPSPRRFAWKRGVVIVGRTVAVAITILLGVYTVQAFSEVLHGPEPLSVPVPAPPDHATGLVVNLGAGTWQLTGSPSMLEGESCPAAELDSRLDVLPDLAVVATPVTPDLRQMISTMTAHRTEKPHVTRYAMDAPQHRLRVFTQGSGETEQWLAFRFAAKSDSGNTWVVSEFRPGTVRANTFPLPVGGTLLATRSGTDQKAQAELVSWVGSVDDLRNAAIAAGWEAAANNPDGFACKQGDRRAWVWVWPGDAPERMATVVFGTPPAR